MKTYSGELKDGMPYKHEDERGYALVLWDVSRPVHNPDKVYYDNEWQLYKPQAKKVWGIPEEGQEFYYIEQDYYGVFSVDFNIEDLSDPVLSPVWLSEKHAIQQKKALNYINEFRALSDVPADRVEQWYIDPHGIIYSSVNLLYKLEFSICGYVANSREKAEQDLAAFPKIALAHKIVTWGFHGIVEEVL